MSRGPAHPVLPAGACLLAAGVLLTACGDGPGDKNSTRAPGIIQELPAKGALEVPAAPGSLAPRLSRLAGGGALLSWMEPDGAGVALRWSRLENGGTWGAPRSVTSSPRLVPNAADTPGVVPLGSDRLVAHWRETREPAGAGYDVRIALSFDAGASWEPAVTPHRDGTDTEHGFVVAFEASAGGHGGDDGRPSGAAASDLTGTGEGSNAGARDLMSFNVGLAWLDGRAAATSPDSFAAQLVTTTLETGGAVGLGVEQVLDARTCDCCPVTVATAGKATLVAYRDRSAEDNRDISMLRRGEDGRWSAPMPLHFDGWRVVGCPVNGPALDAEGRRAAVAWFTASLEDPRVLLSFSEDAGKTWSEPLRIDDAGVGATAGHPAIALLPDGSVIVTWVVRRETTQALVARRVTRDAPLAAPFEIATGVMGIPQMARSDDRVIVAWTAAPRPAAGAPGEPVPARRILSAAWPVSALRPEG